MEEGKRWAQRPLLGVLAENDSVLRVGRGPWRRGEVEGLKSMMFRPPAPRPVHSGGKTGSARVGGERKGRIRSDPKAFWSISEVPDGTIY